MRTVTGLCKRLRDDAGANWGRLHSHPFIAGLASGTLPLDTFRFYVEQNLQYLPEYARAMALAASRADEIETMQIFAADLTTVIETEIPENRDLLERVIESGARDLGGSVGLAPANVAYTSFLVATAATATPLEVMAAILPCTWSYGEIATRLSHDIREHEIFTGWIRFFGSDAYSEIVQRMCLDLERLAGQNPSVPEKRLGELFTRSVQLEEGFWDMALALEHWPDVRALYPLAA
ncbi:MAG: thiaminase II [Thermoleophilia bacterium]